MKSVKVDESVWVIVNCFLVHTTVDALFFTMGLIGSELIERRNYSRESLAWMSTLFVATWKLCSFIPSRLYRLYGCRPSIIIGGLIFFAGYEIAAFVSQTEWVVSLSIGIISGVGNSHLYITTWIAANTYFCKWRQLSNAIVVSGSAIGLVVAPPIVFWLLQEYGIQGTFMLLGAFVFNTVILGALFPKLEHPNAEEEYPLLSQQDPEQNPPAKQEHSTLLEKLKRKIGTELLALDLLKNWRYACFAAAMCLIDPVAIHTVYTYLPDFLIQANYPPEKTWIPLTVIGICNVCGRLLMGVGNKSPNAITVVFFLCSLLIGIIPLSVPFIANYFWLICTNAGIFGLAKGIFWGLRGPVLMEIVPNSDFDRAFGTCEFFCSFVYITCPLQGKLYDITGTYTLTFVLAGLMAIAASFCLFPIVAARAISHRQSESSE